MVNITLSFVVKEWKHCIRNSNEINTMHESYELNYFYRDYNFFKYLTGLTNWGLDINSSLKNFPSRIKNKRNASISEIWNLPLTLMKFVRKPVNIRVLLRSVLGIVVLMEACWTTTPQRTGESHKKQSIDFKKKHLTTSIPSPSHLTWVTVCVNSNGSGQREP